MLIKLLTFLPFAAFFFFFLQNTCLSLYFSDENVWPRTLWASFCILIGKLASSKFSFLSYQKYDLLPLSETTLED